MAVPWKKKRTTFTIQQYSKDVDGIKKQLDAAVDSIVEKVEDIAKIAETIQDQSEENRR